MVGGHVPSPGIESQQSCPLKFDIKLMRRYTSLVHLEQLEMAHQLVGRYTVHFKLCQTEQVTENYTVIRYMYMIATRQQRNEAVTSPETKNSNVSECLHSVR